MSYFTDLKRQLSEHEQGACASNEPVFTRTGYALPLPYTPSDP
jgi:hypothetical protein